VKSVSKRETPGSVEPFLACLNIKINLYEQTAADPDEKSVLSAAKLCKNGKE